MLDAKLSLYVANCRADFLQFDTMCSANRVECMGFDQIDERKKALAGVRKIDYRAE